MWKSCRVSTSGLIILSWDKTLIQWKYYFFQNQSYEISFVQNYVLWLLPNQPKFKKKTRLIFWIRNNVIKFDLLTLQGLYYRQWYSDRHEGHWENTPTLCRPFSCLLHIQRQWGKYNESSVKSTLNHGLLNKDCPWLN